MSRHFSKRFPDVNLVDLISHLRRTHYTYTSMTCTYHKRDSKIRYVALPPENENVFFVFRRERKNVKRE